MKFEDIAAKIPAEYRKEMLDTNMIFEAQAVRGNAHMDYLVTIWKNYIHPTLDETCGRCLEQLKKNMVRLQPFLVELEKQSRMLDSI